MFAVVGLTLDDVWSGKPPQVRLGEILDERKKQGKRIYEPAKPVVVYTTDSNDTQGLVARTKYKDRGAFLIFLFFSDGAVEICNEAGIALRILDHIDEHDLPAKKVTVVEYPSVTPIVRK
jgi:hypothetical protein